MRSAIPLLVLLAAPLVAGGPPDATPESIRTGLLAPGRLAREDALERARRLARTDPALVEDLWERLDLRGRCLLVRALASAGTRHAALVALKHARDPEPAVFRALLEGLAEGGRGSLFASLPEDLPPRRRQAVERLRMQWRVEAELAELKSDSGRTGHYTGQYKRLKGLVPEALDVLFDIVRDSERPLLGEGGAGPYRPIVPAMVFFEKPELRSLAAYSFGELVPPGDEVWLRRLAELFERYWALDEDEHELERAELAPALAFSLHDLGVAEPAERYLGWLQSRLRRPGAIWELGYALMRLGRYDEGVRWYDQLLRAGESRSVTAYNLACAFSVRAMNEPGYRRMFKERALYYLRLAIEEYGFVDWPWMEEDGDLDFLRADPEYKRLLKGLQARFPARPKRKVSKNPEEFLPGD